MYVHLPYTVDTNLVLNSKGALQWHDLFSPA